MFDVLRRPPVVFFLMVNSIFLYKYAPRMGFSAGILIGLYVIFPLLLFKITHRFKSTLQRRSRWGVLTLGALGSLLFLIILFQIPPNTWPVDRWSAITHFNNALLEGRFPYSERSHLNHAISGMPGLFFIALPFQLLGDAGFLQIVSFIGFCILIYWLVEKPEDKPAAVVLVMTSPGFCWEVLARSELFSNMVLLIAVICFFEVNRPHKTRLKMAIGSLLLGIVLSTRTIVIIPVCLYFFTYFKKEEIRLAMLSLGLAVLSFAATILPFALWNWRELLQHQPLINQADKSPLFIMAASVLMTIGLAFYTKTFTRFVYISGCLLFMTLFATFLYQISVYGWTAVIFQHRFDISYLQLCMPFLILSIFDLQPESMHQK